MEFSTEQERLVQMIFQNGDSETLFVTPQGPDSYRMECTSIIGEATYHDIIEAELQTDGTLRFIRLLMPSGLKTVSCILSHSRIESPKLTLFLNKVAAVGGYWEKLFGGGLILNLPPAEHDRMIGEFESLFSEER